MPRQQRMYCLAACLAACLVAAAAVLDVRAQQQTDAPVAPKALVPMAASTLAASPDAHWGDYVTLMGAVDERFSRTVFSVDQDPKRRTGKDVLIVAPTLNGDVAIDSYVTVIGDVIRFDPSEIARARKDYTLDVSSEIVERYRGRPAILATSVINAALIDLTRRTPPPMTADDEALGKVMKQVGPAFTALRQAAGDSSAERAKQQTAALKQAFAETEAFWRSRARPDAIGWAQDARKAVDAVDRDAASGNWDAVKASSTALGQACQSCHAAYRERFDDGSFRIKKYK